MPNILSQPEFESREPSSIDSGYNSNVAKNLEAQLDSLGKEQQDFIAAHLTPEMAGIMGLVLGQEAFDYFNNLADPTKILVPMSRDQVQGQGQPAQAPAPQPQQAAIQPRGPQQGPLS